MNLNTSVCLCTCYQCVDIIHDHSFATKFTSKSMMTSVDNIKALTDIVMTRLDCSYACITTLLQDTANWMQLLTHSVFRLE